MFPIFRIIWLKTGHGKTYISSGILLPSKVTHLVIKRPPHFHFRPGDYVFVSIPAIAKYEWHPFTLSSAPEQDDYMWLHIRGVGEWTNRLYSYFEKEQARLHQSNILPSGHGTIIANLDHVHSSIESSTPQKDFLVRKNLEQFKKSQMPMRTPNEKINSTPATLENESEIEKKENPFKFDMVQSLEKSSECETNKTSTDNVIESPPRNTKFERQLSETSSTIRKIQASLQRTFSRKGPQEGISNDGFIANDSLSEKELKVKDSNFKCHSSILHTIQIDLCQSCIYYLFQKPLQKSATNEPRNKDLTAKSRTPLEKSLSMPDIENRVRRRNRLMALKEYNRSESERSFDETQMKKARLKSLGLAYLSPQNRSLAQSFRYMRNKPTIIAFKTPSLENWEQRQSQTSISEQ